MGDTFNLSGDFRDGVQYLKCTFQLPPDEQRQFEASLNQAKEKLTALPTDTIPEASPLPPGSRLLFYHNPLFVGREQNLMELAQIMVKGGVAAVGQLVAATGLGGIGKTQLTSEFCHRYGCYFAGGVFWMSFADPEEVPTEIARCGGLQGMNLIEDFDNQPLESQLQMVLTQWHSPLPRLLVFDNCEDPALIARWRPRTGGCRIIITSRRDRWDPALGIHPLALGVLSPTESCSLLAEYRPDLLDAPHLGTIAKALGHLPLALHLAGSYLNLYPHSPLGDPARYLEKLQDPALLAHPSLSGNDGHSPTEHEQHVGKTFALSWDQLDPEDTTDTIALNLLSEAAVLAPGEPIPRAMLMAISQPEQPDEAFLIDQEDALQRILSLGLVQSEADGSLVMHRLVGLYVRQQSNDWVDVCDRAETVLYNTAKEINEYGLPAPLLPWRIHLQHVAEHAETRGSKVAGKLWNELGHHLIMVADYEEARIATERALSIDETAFGSNHPNITSHVNNLGLALMNLGHLNEARKAFERALTINEAAFGPEHQEVAININNLGLVLSELGYPEKAFAAFKRAMTISETNLEPDDPGLATYINNLGTALIDLGDLEGGRSKIEQALVIDEAAFGNKHPKVAIRLSSFGGVLHAIGDLEEAWKAYDGALSIYLETLGPNHPDVATAINNLGGVMHALGDLDGARKAYEQSLNIDEAIFGKDHHVVAVRLNNLGLLLRDLGDLQEAKKIFIRNLAINEATFGPIHKKTGTAVHNLGLIFKDLGDLKGARAAFEQSLIISKQLNGSNSPVTKKIRDQLNILDTD
ncbi:MAG: tetratricopeptide repeat protein [Candidatus Thiodiazotropha weberae]|nr:tetratricopeptide repeat protein [Candidatus Thiodiazotropha weberae]